MTTAAAQYDTLDIQPHLVSKYQVFDRSGKLPFHIIFGLCRRSPRDTDPRSLVFDIKGSVFDVPYALATGLLKLRVKGTDRKTEEEVDVSSLPKSKGESTYKTLPSPVHRPRPYYGSKTAQFTTYSYRIAPDSGLAALLKTGGRYVISLATSELVLKLQSCIDAAGQQLSSDSQFGLVSERTHVFSSKPRSGSAVFKVVNSLPWPPEVVTHMRFRPDEASSDEQAKSSMLELSFTNTASTPVSVQCRGPQHYLESDDLFVVDFPCEDRRPRITDSHASAWSCLQIEDAKNGEIIHQHKNRRRICSLYDNKADRRIRLSDLVTLMPGEPFVRCVDVSEKLVTLADGEYRIRLRASGAWWCSGTVEQIADEEDDRVPRRLHRTTIPPLLLRCDETVVLRVVDGRVAEQVA